jgi:hypothetical protein
MGKKIRSEFYTLRMAVVNKFVEEIVAVLGDVEITEEMLKEINKLAKKFYDGATKKAGTKKAAKGAKKADDAEKRPPNGYMSFSKQVRELVKKANPDMDTKQLTAEIAKQWNEEKEADTETYQKYTQAASKEMEEYKKRKSEKSQKSESSGSDSESEKPEKKKRAPSAYNIFFSLKYAEFTSSGMNPADAKKEISKVWGEMSPEQKDEYKGKDLSPKKTKKVDSEEAKPAVKKPAVKKTKQAEEEKKEEEVKPPAKKPKKDEPKKDEEAKPAAKKADEAKPKEAAKKADEAKPAAKKSDEAKPKEAAKKTKEVAKQVVEEEEEDVDMEEFDDTTVPPPKVGGHKKDLPK